MLSITLLVFLTIVTFALTRRQKYKWLKGLFFLFFNWLILEICIYGYFIHLALEGSSFLLIGHQKFLDQLIRVSLIERIHAEERDLYSSFRIDPELGYKPAENKFIYQYPSTNSEGLRADREYTLIPPADSLRVAVFGDSFVYGDGEITQNT